MLCKSCDPIKDCNPAIICMKCAEELAERSLAELAAPKLLAACEAIVLAARMNDPAMGAVAATLAEAAIAKAKGEDHVDDVPKDEA